MRWADVLIERQGAPRALAALAHARVVELNAGFARSAPFELSADAGVAMRLGALDAALTPLKAHLPRLHPGGLDERSLFLEPAEALDKVEQTVAAWLAQARGLVLELRDRETRYEQLSLVQTCVNALPGSGLDLGELVRQQGDASLRYTPFLVLVPRGAARSLETACDELLLEVYPLDATDVSSSHVALGVCPRSALPELERHLHATGARFARIPASVHGPPRAAAQAIERLLDEQQRDAARIRAELERLNEAHGLAAALWLLERHRWLQDVLRQTSIGARFIWFGGWVVENDCQRLRAALEASNVPFLLSFEAPAPERHGEAPVALNNPPWARPFEVFVRGFGLPSGQDVDPSPMLAFLVPLMFGFMFGDIGQGAVLVAAGYWLRKRFPMMKLLIPAGFMAMLFGLAYGSVFGIEHWLHPLWLHPLEESPTVLLVPLGFGALLLVVSILLAGVQAALWGRLSEWLFSASPGVLIYLALLSAIVSSTAAMSLGVISLSVLLLGAFFEAKPGERLSHAFVLSIRRLAELVETTVQLVVNTLSFARLGAFALAHAGLSLAVVTLADGASTVALKIVIFVLGNLAIILLEGLVASIQTTRLIMFEFFRRFVSGIGRPFQPLTLPDEVVSSSAA